MMDNYAKSTEMATEAINSQGLANSKNEVYLTSIEAKLTILKSKITAIFESMISSSVLKGVVDALTVLVDTFGNLTMAVTIAGTAILLFKGNAIKTAIVGIYNYITAMTSLAVMNGVVGTSTIALTTAFNSLKVAFATNPIGFVAVAVLSLVGAYNMLNEVEKKRSERAQENLTQIRSLSSEINEIDKLISKKKELDGIENKNDTQKNNLIETEKKLASLLPDTTTKYNEQNEALSTNTKLLEEASASKKKELTAQAYSTKTDLDGGIEDTAKKLEDAIKRRDSMVEALNKGKPVIGRKMTDFGYADVELTGDKVSKELDRLKGVITNSQKDIDAYNSAVKLLNNVLGENYPLVGNITKSTKDNTKSKEDNAKATQEQALSQEAIQKNMEALEKTYDSAINTMSFYAKALKEIDTNGNLSSATTKEIAKDHRELAPYLDDTATLYQKIQEEMANEKGVAENTYDSILMMDSQFFKNISSNKDLLNKLKAEGYSKDFQNAKNLAEAQVKLNVETIKIIAGAWASYFDAQGKVKWGDFNSDMGVTNGDDPYHAQSRGMINTQNKISKMQDDIAKKNKENADRLNAFKPKVDFGGLASDLQTNTKVGRDSSSKTDSQATKATNAYEDALKSLNTQLKEQDSNLAKLNTHGQDYIDGLSAKSKLIQQEIDLTNTYISTLQKVKTKDDDVFDKIESSKSQLIDLKNQLIEISKITYDSKLGQFDDKIKEYEDRNAIYKNESEMTTDGDKKAGYDKEILSNLQKQLVLLKQKREFIESEIASNKFTNAQQGEMNAQRVELIGAESDLLLKIKQVNDERLNIIKTAEDKVTEIIKNQVEERKKLIDDEYNAKKEAID